MKQALTDNPLVSIVIPAFNGARYICASIDSILKQDYPHIELLVFDDGSTDETIQILEQYGRNFIWETQPNVGQSATLNKGWQQSKGDILAYLSVDDILAPTAVTQAVSVLVEHPDMPVVYGDYDLIDENGKLIRHVHAPDFDYQRLIAEIEVQPGPGAFFRREVFDFTGGWNPNLKQTPDFDFWLKAGLLGEFQHIKANWAQFRVHRDSQTHAEASPTKAAECVSVIEDFYGLPNLPPSVISLKKRALSSSHTVSARAHIRSGRYGNAFKHLRLALSTDKGVVLNLRAWKMILSGFRYRFGKAGASR